MLCSARVIELILELEVYRKSLMLFLSPKVMVFKKI